MFLNSTKITYLLSNEFFAAMSAFVDIIDCILDKTSDANQLVSS
jgi:hypothetical protein